MDQRSREHNGENQEPPKTRSLREDHPERGHQRLQGAKLSHRPRHKPQPAEMRVVYQRQPQTPSKGQGRQHGTLTWDREEDWREPRTTEGHGHSEDHLATHPEGQGAQKRPIQRCEVQPGTDQCT